MPLADAISGVSALMMGMIWMAISLFLHNVRSVARREKGVQSEAN
jgi:hypothetical protein